MAYNRKLKILTKTASRHQRASQKIMFQVLGSRCFTGSALLDCHVLKGFGIYMIGILDS